VLLDRLDDLFVYVSLLHIEISFLLG